MNELLIPLRWDKLITLTMFVDTSLSAQHLPTHQRLQAISATEDFFSDAIETPGSSTTQLRCRIAPGQVTLCREKDGVPMQEQESCCIISVK